MFQRRGICWTAGILLLVAAFVAGARWRGRGDDGPRHEVAVAGPADVTAGNVQMYTCAMHPQVRSPDPDGQCPICFMDLIPVPGDDDDVTDDATVPRLRLSARAAALMDIRTWPVERRAVDISIDLFGKIGYDESRLYDIVARTESYVERLAVNTPWQSVARGEVLADVYSPAVVTAFRELLVAAKGPAADGRSGDGRTGMLTAARARLMRRGVSAAQIDAVIASGDVPRTFQVESPAAGMALPMLVREGEWLREGGRLMRIADLSRVWVNLEAYERDLPWLAVGRTVRFSVAAYPGETFDGTISFIDPVVHERSRTVRLRVVTDNPGGRFKPGMLVSASLNGTLGNGTLPPSPAELQRAGRHDIPGDDPGDATLPLVIPATAPLIMGRRALVYVRLHDDEDRLTFEPRAVTLGPRAGDYYIVRQGLDDGDQIVVNGQFKIDSELQIRGRPSMMAPAGGNPPAHDHGPGGQAGSVAPIAGQGDDGHDGHAAGDLRLQTHCPIMGGEINRDLFHDHDGRRIYVCCPGCLDEVRERADEIIEAHRQRGIVFERVE